MLDPRGRQLLLDSLRPPDGFRFDCAVGTTFSLDLLALLTTPLAFAMFDWQDDAGTIAADPTSPKGDPLTLLESLRRCADRIHLFCQAGQICVPPGNQRLFAYLEQAVVEVEPPAAKLGGQAVFHPKVWAIRYTGPAGAVRYRLLCLSRNLTFDRSWDTILVLDGTRTGRQKSFAANRPLAEFFAALPGMAVRSGALGLQGAADCAMIADELRVVEWERPEDVHEVRFVPLGLGSKPSWPFPREASRLLVVSPFVTEGFLRRAAVAGRTQYLVSRPECLRELDPDVLAGQWSCFTLDDGIEHATTNDDEAQTPTAEALAGLHAKLFVADGGKRAYVWTGSANATDAAFEGNVEFLVELEASKARYGVEAAIADTTDRSNLRSLLSPFIPAEAAAIDTNARKAEELADTIRRRLARLPLSLRVEQAQGGTGWTTRLESPEHPPSALGVSLRCRPIMLAASADVSIDAGAPVALDFGPHAAESISSFVSFSVTARVGDAERIVHFVLNLPLTGAPADRKERLLRDLLRDSRTLLRFLLMLLSDDPERLLADLRDSIAAQGTTAADANAGDLLPLLEHMLRALHDGPEKLDQVQRLVDDLRKTPEGREILPPELDLILDPIGRARVRHKARVAGGAT